MESIRLSLFRRPTRQTIALNLLPDGTIPPRLVTPDASLWLKGNGDSVTLPSGLTYFAANDTHQVRVGTNEAYTVNGKRLVGRYRLTDGDYIAGRNFRAIFQVDPAKDWRDDWEASEEGIEATIDITLTRRLEKAVLINGQGISLAGAEHVTEWDRFAFIAFYREITTGHWAVRVSNGAAFAESHFERTVLTVEETNTLLNWIIYAMPFHVSFVHNSRASFPNAYDFLAYSKLLDPSQAGERELPTPPHNLFPLLTPRQTVLRLLREALKTIPISIALFFIIRLMSDIPLSGFWGVLAVVNLVFALTRYTTYFRHLEGYRSFVSKYGD